MKYLVPRRKAQYADTVREAMYRGIHGLFISIVWKAARSSWELAAQIMNIENLEELLIAQISVNISPYLAEQAEASEAATLEERYEVL